MNLCTQQKCKSRVHGYGLCFKHYRLKNLEHIKEKRKEYYRRNKEKELESNRKYKDQNRKKWKDYDKAYYLEHKAEYIGRVFKRRSRKQKATPVWLSAQQIKEMNKFYRDCPQGYEVDHIIPLQGESISGLHVPWNLQYLPADKNREKSNKFDPSKYEEQRPQWPKQRRKA